ncbi:pertactin-like passenger domain-containing protein [Pseudomonas sp. Irchel s3b5]|uniref:pertactin-like passenger domain-containing protein n=1 Tax=Pseudomonas sp. Irchel s3b5 TaxID=2009077 RepID=UPI000BA41C56|nr:pertactin-like passenger domain-containing protein [Pseudomonas sp. Irchel s3b5]
MPTVRLFKLNPLARALKVLSVTPFLLFCDLSHARVLNPNEVLNIDGGTAPDNYVLNGDSTLNANGAQTRDIAVNQSTLNLKGSAVQATGANGVHVNAGRADIAGSNISSDRVGLAISRDAAATQGGSATVSDSAISGATAGATVNAMSSLTLQRSTLTGTGANGTGLRVFDGTATATDSTITGGGNGIQIANDLQVSSPSTLVLNNTDVTALNGSAIVVDTVNAQPSQANIAVTNGSTLTASNGILMDVRRGAEGNLRVDNSTLVGDIVADGSSTAHVLLENSATLTGRLENVQSLAVNSNAKWVMVGDSKVGDLTLNGGGIQFGNPGEFFKLSVDSLSGSGGTFYMHNNFATGQIDTLVVTGNATGNHLIDLESSGSEPLAASSTPVVQIGSGDAQFALSKFVDLGAYSYDLVKQGDTDW